MEQYERYWIGFGDLHGDVSRVAEVPGLAQAEGVILTGDLTTRGDRAQAARILDAVAAVNPRILAQIGNMDSRSVETLLDERGVNVHGRGLELAPGVGLMAVGWSTPTPFGTPSEMPDASLAELLEQAHAQVAALGPFQALLLVSHEPPRDTRVDRVAAGMHVGSPSVRAFIERVQPDVCLSGHIHEARATDAIGRTTIINPGMLARGGYAVIGLKGGRLHGELHTL